MKNSIPILIFSLVIISLSTNFFILSQEIENEHKKVKNFEEYDEFDDPSLLKKKKEKKVKKKKKEEPEEIEKEEKDDETPKEEKKTEKKEQNNNDDELYPSIEELRQDELGEINKYKLFLMKYYYELIMLSILLIFIINAIIGVKENRKIAEKWFNKNKDFFIENYSHLGGEREYNPNNLSLIKDSYNVYKFFASGRVYVTWMIVELNFKKRQDLISLLSQLFLFWEKDRVMYEVSLSPSEDVPCIFAICKKKDIKLNKKNYRELNEFAEISNPSFIDKNYVILTEDEDTTNKIFTYNNQFLSQYRKVEKFIELIFFTDRRSCKDKHGLVVSFELKNGYTEGDFYDMTLFTHMLVDVLGSTSVKASYRKEANGRRKEYEAKISRELAEKNREEIQNAKEEKKNAERNKATTREQLKKLEEKEKKEALKERRKRFKMLKV